MEQDLTKTDNYATYRWLDLESSSLLFGPQEGVSLSNNKVTIEFDPMNSDYIMPDFVYGALTLVTSDTTVSNNEVNVEQGLLRADVYGAIIYNQEGSSASVTAQNNTINLNGGAGFYRDITGAHVASLGKGDATLLIINSI